MKRLRIDESEIMNEQQLNEALARQELRRQQQVLRKERTKRYANLTVLILTPIAFIYLAYHPLEGSITFTWDIIVRFIVFYLFSGALASLRSNR